MVGHHWRLARLNSTVIVLSITSQISYASTSAALSDRSVYPNLFRTVPSDESLAPALATVMQYYGWRTLCILTEQEAQFTMVHPLHVYSKHLVLTLYLKHVDSFAFSRVSLILGENSFTPLEH